MVDLVIPGAARPVPVAACVLDAYGTLLDVQATLAMVVRRHRGAALPLDDATVLALGRLWRDKQLAYSWLRSLMRRHSDFAAVTADALDHALLALGMDGDQALRQALLAAYAELLAFPEVPVVLAQLAATGLPLAVLSNGTPAMLEAALANAGLRPHLAAVLSVESVGVYKPAPEVYALATQHFAVAAAQILFVSGNGWDAHGAAAFGCTVIRLDRQGGPPEALPGRPAHVIRDLRPLPALLRVAGSADRPAGDA